jgi:hypothetical protein
MRALAATVRVLELAASSSVTAESYRDLVEAYLAGDRGATLR